MKYIICIKNKIKNIIADNKELFQILLPSVLATVICFTCMLGGTFAWFNESSKVEIKRIKSSSYFLETLVLDGEDEVKIEDGKYSLDKEKTYKIFINVKGNATKGFINVQIDTRVFSTKQVKVNNNISFTLTPDEDVEISFVPVWGLKKDSSNPIDFDSNYGYDSKDGSLSVIQLPKEEEKNEDDKKEEVTIDDQDNVNVKKDESEESSNEINEGETEGSSSSEEKIESGELEETGKEELDSSKKDEKDSSLENE